MVKIDGLHLRLYDEIRRFMERVLRKTSPLFKQIENYRMEVEEEADYYRVYFYEKNEPDDPKRERGLQYKVMKGSYRVYTVLRGRSE